MEKVNHRMGIWNKNPHSLAPISLYPQARSHSGKGPGLLPFLQLQLPCSYVTFRNRNLGIYKWLNEPLARSSLSSS